MEKNTFTAREFVDRHKPKPKNAARAAWFNYGIDMQKWIANNLHMCSTAAEMWEKLLEMNELDGLRWVVTRKDMKTPWEIQALLISMISTTPVPNGRMVIDTDGGNKLNEILGVLQLKNSCGTANMDWNYVKYIETQCRMAVKKEMENDGRMLFIDMHNAMKAVNAAFVEAYRNMGNPFEKETEK